MSVFLMPFLKLLSVGADLSSWLILDQNIIIKLGMITNSFLQCSLDSDTQILQLANVKS